MHEISTLVVNEYPIFARRTIPIRKHKRFIFPRISHLFVTGLISFDFFEICVVTKPMLDVSGSHKVRNTFVQPEVVPIAASHHVTPPLMRKLMRSQPDILLVSENPFTIRLVHRREAAHLLFNAT